MKSSPPNGMGRATWDGICIVVLRKEDEKRLRLDVRPQRDD